MKVLFFAGILLPGIAARAQTDSLLAQLARKWQHARAYTLEVAALMPASGYDFRPVPEERSFRDQLLHIAQNIYWLSSSYISQEKNPQPEVDTNGLTKEKVMQIVGDAYDYGLEAIRRLSPATLDDPVKFFAGPMTRRQILLLLQDHQTHHRGQLIVYLRLKGIKPPDYVGW